MSRPAGPDVRELWRGFAGDTMRALRFDQLREPERYEASMTPLGVGFASIRTPCELCNPDPNVCVPWPCPHTPKQE